MKGGPFGVFCFVGYVKKVKKTKGGTLCSKFALVELGLSELISFCKKWYIRDELCGRTKKQDGNVPSRRHILGSKIFKEQLL